MLLGVLLLSRFAYASHSICRRSVFVMWDLFTS